MLRVSIDGEISNNGMRYLHTAPRYQQSFKKKTDEVGASKLRISAG